MSGFRNCTLGQNPDRLYVPTPQLHIISVLQTLSGVRESMDLSQLLEEPFPAQSKQATGSIDGIATEASALFFSDKLLVTLSQEGRLSQWIQVPLSAPSPATVDMALANPSLLPMAHLTPKTLLGGGGEERESLAQLYAVQIASHIARRDSEERRMLVIGLGLKTLRPERAAFFDIIELIQKLF